MILESIALTNFGVYRGRQEAVLAPPDEHKPIVLFGGMNGGGKTTLLDAIQLVLYGSKARCAGRGRLGYREYLREMIHRGVSPTEGAAIELCFRRAVDGDVHYYRLVRSWKESNKGIEEAIEVTRDAEIDPLLSEHWEEYIESYIPSGIAHLFFFDAEQIKELADGERSAEILGTAVHTLLGLDLVDRLDTDLIALSRRKRAALQTPEEAETFRKAQEQLDSLQVSLDESKQGEGVLGNEVGRVEKELASCEARFRQEGGDLFLLRSELEAERAALEKALLSEETLLRDIAAGPVPLLLIGSLLEESARRATEDALARRNALLLDALEERDTKVVQRLQAEKIAAKHLAVIEDVLKLDRSERVANKQVTLFAHDPDNVLHELRYLRSTKLPESKAAAEQVIEKIGSIQERLTRCELELARVPSEEAIAAIQADLIRLRHMLREKQALLAAQEDKSRVLARQLEDAKRRFARELGQEVEAQVDREHDNRVLKHSARVRETLARFRVAVIRKHADRLESLVMESFRYLLRKRSLVTGLRVDPSTFRIELTGGDGKALPFDRLSAGERQLLATSLLWGLAKASGRPLPTIIDTPLGRLDSSHRRHLLERYFPVASHQVILLSTDEEVDEANLDRLRKFVGRSYTLAFDENTNGTSITPGYFWKHEAAN